MHGARRSNSFPRSLAPRLATRCGRLSLIAALVVFALAGSFALLNKLRLNSKAAAFRLSNALGSHMVLQRAPQAATLWGASLPGDRVQCTLQLHGYESDTDVASSDTVSGDWAARFRPHPAGGPHTIICTSALLPGASITLTDVYFGDVFLCGGQSNMAFPVQRSFTAEAEVARAASRTRSGLRLFAAGPDKSPLESTPQRGFRTVSTPWSIASSAVVSDFSAVCWSFGVTLYDDLGGTVPIGLLSSAAGGTCIEKWSPDAALDACSQPPGQGVLWGSMIAPLIPHTRLAGVLWYQGESNVAPSASGTCGVDHTTFQCAFTNLVSAWRLAFRQPDLFWAHVQLAPYTPPPQSDVHALAEVRQAQLAATGGIAGTALVPAVDLGDAASPFKNIHPRSKRPIGERLAGAVLQHVYNETEPSVRRHWRSPVCVSAQVDAASVRVLMHVEPGDTLRIKAEGTCPKVADVVVHCGGWQLRSATLGTWHAAHAVRILSHDEQGAAAVMVAPSDDVEDAGWSGVRYAWADWPLLSIFTTNGLPALPCTLDIRAAV